MTEILTDKVVIRDVTAADAERLLEIYTPYVTDTAVSFEYDPPTVDEFRGRIAATKEKYPYIAAELDGKLIGYCYVGGFHTRAAYVHSVETSIYIDRAFRRMGVGRALYDEMERRLRAMGVTNLYAGAAYIEQEDEYLTHDSVKFHEKCGFVRCARFHGCGVKFGRRYDLIYLEKLLR